MSGALFLKHTRNDPNLEKKKFQMDVVVQSSEEKELSLKSSF